MRKITILTYLIFFISSLIFGQEFEKYSEFVEEAKSLYIEKEYAKSAEKYKFAFDQLDGKAYPKDRYHAACAFALANNFENSFYHLFYLAENPKIMFRDYDKISTDSCFISLHSEKRWKDLIAIIKNNQLEFEKTHDIEIMAILDTIYQEDQKYRQRIDSIEKKHGWKSSEMQSLWKIINHKDSINQIKVKKILDEHGWLGPNVIGNQGNQTLFLVIQHSDLKTQEKYLPMMREAVKIGNAKAYSLALLEDRVALGKGQKQIYGSQIGRNQETGEYYVQPLIDPENVNKRREEVGLGTIQEYISRWGISWNVEEYKKKMTEYEAKQE